MVLFCIVIYRKGALSLQIWLISEFHHFTDDENFHRSNPLPPPLPSAPLALILGDGWLQRVLRTRSASRHPSGHFQLGLRLSKWFAMNTWLRIMWWLQYSLEAKMLSKVWGLFVVNDVKVSELCLLGVWSLPVWRNRKKSGCISMWMMWVVSERSCSKKGPNNSRSQDTNQYLSVESTQQRSYEVSAWAATNQLT
jgi:hypothetical protein